MILFLRLPNISLFNGCSEALIIISSKYQSEQMKRIISLIFLVFVSVHLFAQSVEDRYFSRMTQDGTLYFIVPKKLGKCSGIKKFEYDMTYLSWSDSVTVNFTFRSKSVACPSELKIESCENLYLCSNYSLLFTDIVKDGYEIRVTSKFSVDEIERVLKCSESPVFMFKQDGVLRTAEYSKGAWDKDRKKLIDIYNLYKLSK